MSSNPGPSIKIEPDCETTPKLSTKSQLDCELSHGSEDTSDSYLRLSFVNQDNMKHMFQKTVNIECMRSFLSRVKQFSAHLSQKEELELLLITVSCIDLTTLAGDDTTTNVERLCYRALNSLDEETIPEYKDVKCAAVCVYPARVSDCANTFERIGAGSSINIAAVATGFPSGQYGLATRIGEIKDAVESGATEIDVVINRPAAISANWATVFDEICAMRKACDFKKSEGKSVHLKVIIGAGDLLTSTPNTIYSAGFISILAGADFIKTSTGKEGVNATLPIGYIMMRCIIDYYNLTGIKIGFKPAGGIRTYKDALNWLILVKLLLGPEWMNNKLFRFGASGLLDDVEKRIQVLTKQQRQQVSSSE